MGVCYCEAQVLISQVDRNTQVAGFGSGLAPGVEPTFDPGVAQTYSGTLEDGECVWRLAAA